jgi:SAM-dependent methyltransferase
MGFPVSRHPADAVSPTSGTIRRWLRPGPLGSRVLYHTFTILFRHSGVFYTIFYRMVFGRSGWLARRLSEVAASVEVGLYRGDVPKSKHYWDQQYKDGIWRCLRRLPERPRYNQIVGYLNAFKPGGSVLDIGCGEGLMRDYLSKGAYSSYLGIDISAEAIRLATQKGYSEAEFVTADAAEYLPPESYDVIIFNEVLYYLSQPLAVVQRYARFLKPGGLFVVSLFRTPRTEAIRKQLAETYDFTDEIVIAHQQVGMMWIFVIEPGENGRRAGAPATLAAHRALRCHIPQTRQTLRKLGRLVGRSRTRRRTRSR